MIDLAVRRERIVTLDILRGFFMSVIIADHLHYFPGLFELLGGRGELWVSAAEGFFLISGLLVGYIYAPKMAANFAFALKKIWRRAALLYVWAAALTTIAVIWAHHVTGPIKEGLWWNPPLLEYAYKVLTLQYNYGWANFLQYYVLFMLFAPLAVWLCIKRKAWLVMLVSVTIYLFRGQNFNMAWQLMFMGGLVIGYYLPAIESWARNLPKKTKKNALHALVAATLISLTASVVITNGGNWINSFTGGDVSGSVMAVRDTLLSWNTLLANYVEKWTLEPMRIFFALLWFTTLYIVIRPREQWVDKKTFGFFRTIGEVSLLIYGAHALVIFGAHLYLPLNMGYITNTIVTALFLGFFYCLARYRKVFKLKASAAIQSVKRYNRMLWNQQ